MITINQLLISWGWAFPAGIDRILAVSEFGNILLVSQGKMFRVCVEDCEVKEIKGFTSENAVWADPTFVADWECKSWKTIAEKGLGKCPPGKCIAFKIPRILGGQDSIENLYYATPHDYISAFGDIADQIANLPDGAKVRLTIVP